MKACAAMLFACLSHVAAVELPRVMMFGERSATDDLSRLARCAGGSARLVNSIIARNTFQGSIPADITGSPALEAASTNNLIGTGGSGGLVDGVNGNRVGVSAAALKIAALASNGGPTATMVLLPGSPAINAGVVIAGISDQRGITRSQRGAPDIGAFDFDGPLSESLVVTTTVDERDFTSDPAFGTGITLREALACAQFLGGAPTITFTPALHGQTVTPTEGATGAGDDTALRNGSDLTIDGGAIFNVAHDDDMRLVFRQQFHRGQRARRRDLEQ
jgi:hypothetical protein